MNSIFRLLCVVLVCCSAFACNASKPTPTAASHSAVSDERIVVLISLDGLAGFYFDDPKAEMPNLRRLAREGAFSNQMRPSTPSVTWPNHTSMVTGMTAGTHGVTGNSFLNRATLETVPLIGDTVFDKEQIVRVPTIYDLAHESGVKTAAMRWPGTRNAHSLDYAFPDTSDPKILESTTTPALLAECRAKGIWNENSTDQKGKLQHNVNDEMTAKVFHHVVVTHRPGLALLHLIDVDHDQHKYGPRTPEAYAAIGRVDKQVGEVIETLNKEFPGRATVFVVSDHGFSPINQLILPNVILRDAGLVTVKGTRIVGGSVRTVIQGGCTMVYFTDPTADKAELQSKVTAAFTNAKGIDKVVRTSELWKYGVGNPMTDKQAPDMLIFAAEGYAFGATSAGVMTFQDKPETKGTHGHNPDLPHLNATFIAWGQGIKPNTRLGPITNLDIAPTMAEIMKLRLSNPEGRVLTVVLDK